MLRQDLPGSERQRFHRQGATHSPDHNEQSGKHSASEERSDEVKIWSQERNRQEISIH